MFNSLIGGTEAEKQIIVNGMNHIASKTCVTFIPKTSSTTNNVNYLATAGAGYVLVLCMAMGKSLIYTHLYLCNDNCFHLLPSGIEVMFLHI